MALATVTACKGSNNSNKERDDKHVVKPTAAARSKILPRSNNSDEEFGDNEAVAKPPPAATSKDPHAPLDDQSIGYQRTPSTTITYSNNVATAHCNDSQTAATNIALDPSGTQSDEHQTSPPTINHSINEDRHVTAPATACTGSNDSNKECDDTLVVKPPAAARSKILDSSTQQQFR